MRFLLFSLACVLTIAMPLRAQRRNDARVGASHLARPEASTYRATVAVDPAPGPRRWPYIVGGALAGAVVTGAAVAKSVNSTDDAMVAPIAYIGVLIAAGTIAGVAVGWLVSEVVR